LGDKDSGLEKLWDLGFKSRKATQPQILIRSKETHGYIILAMAEDAFEFSL
jgi:hypothetical protein